MDIRHEEIKEILCFHPLRQVKRMGTLILRYLATTIMSRKEIKNKKKRVRYLVLIGRDVSSFIIVI